VVTDAKDNDRHHWQVRTYDSDYALIDLSKIASADTTCMIDKGIGGYINVDVVSPIVSFNAEAFDTTNGVSTKYYFSWFSDIPTMNGDFIYISMPAELTMKPTSGNALDCKGQNGFGTGPTAVVCQKQGNHLKVTL
jgi:hypothetical protein